MLLSALAQLSACLIVWNFHIPNPNIVLFVVLSAVLVKYGYAAGIVSGLIAFLYSAFFFSTDHSFFLYTSLNLQKLIVIGLGIAANILLIGRLQWQFERSSMEKMQAEAEEKLQETTESYRAKLYHDVLTGTYNRRYYEDIASRMVGPAGVALLDVDDFKICNDTYGHYAGDDRHGYARRIRLCEEAVKQVVIEEHLRGEVVAARVHLAPEVFYVGIYRARFGVPFGVARPAYAESAELLYVRHQLVRITVFEVARKIFGYVAAQGEDILYARLFELPELFAHVRLCGGYARKVRNGIYAQRLDVA